MKFEVLTKVSDASELAYTREGFGKIRVRMTRTGVQPYYAWELGADGDPNRLVNVYRGADEVGKAESLESFKHKTLTLGHPGRDVDLKNWYMESQGEISTDVEFVDGFVEATIYIKGKDAIAAILAGTQELSAGYIAFMVKKSGRSPEGVNYEYVQEGIYINHLAIVPRGRAGFECRIIVGATIDSPPKGFFCCKADENEGEPSQTDSGQPEPQTDVKEKEIPMTDKPKVMLSLGDSRIKVDADISDSIQSAFDSQASAHKRALATQDTTHESAISDLKTAHKTALSDLGTEHQTAMDTAKTAHDAALEVKDAELVAANDKIKDLKSKMPTLDSLNAAIADRIAVIDGAKHIGVELTNLDKTSTRDLRLQVIHAKGMGKDYTDETADKTINDVFTALTTGSPKATPHKGAVLDGSGGATSALDRVAKAMKDGKAARQSLGLKNPIEGGAS